MDHNRSKSNQSIGLKRCGCLNHQLYTINESVKFYLRSQSFFIRRNAYSELLRRKLVDRTTSTICTVCLKYGKDKVDERKQNTTKNIPCEESTDISDADVDDNLTVNRIELGENENLLPMDISTCNEESMEIITQEMGDDENGCGDERDDNSIVDSIKNLTREIKNLKWSEIDDDNLKQSLCDLAENLGFLIRTDLNNEKDDMAEKCKSFENLVSINFVEWYQQKNQLLTSFIYGCTGVNEKNENKKKFNAAVHAVEQIHYTKNINMVTPISFMRNILTYIISRSKMSCNIVGAFEGSGSYTKVNSLLNMKSDPLTIQDVSDITVTFDNEQKVGRHTGRIREKSKQPLSIITTVGVIESNPKKRSQFEEVQREELNITETLEQVDTLEKMYRDVMRKYRMEFVTEIIEAVEKEQKSHRKQCRDYVDVALRDAGDGMFVCPVCCHIEDELFEICPQPSCLFNTSFFDHGYDKYHRTQAQHIESPEINYAEPVLVNPSSYVNVKLVLESIESEVFAEEKERKWVVVMCDGVPYNFSSIMQDNYKVCGICSELVEIGKLADHSQCHNEIESGDIEYRMPFERIFLRPGPGHIELNMARKLLSFLWVPLMKEVAIGLGFRTPNALKGFKNGIDDHRSCQVLETCLFALAKELLVPYVQRCIIRKNVPTAEEYVSWYNESVKSQNYGFLFHVTFWYLLSFMVFKEGVRKNNSDIMMAGRSVFAPLFYCGHHPKYQRLFLRDLVERVNYPDTVSPFMKLTESHSVSGKPYGGQGGDFIHEEINKNIKSYLHGSGIPTKMTWVNIIRKAKTIDAMKCTIFENGSMNAEKGKKRPKRFEHEITMVRKTIRKERFLDQCEEEEMLTSLSGEPLDISLCDFSYVAMNNYEDYKKELTTNCTYGTKQMPPIFVTAEDRVKFEMIENKTIKEIKSELRNMAFMMREKDAASILNQKLGRKTNLKKHQYIEIYYESMKILELQEAEKASLELHVDNNNNVDEEEDDH